MQSLESALLVPSPQWNAMSGIPKAIFRNAVSLSSPPNRKAEPDLSGQALLSLDYQQPRLISSQSLSSCAVCAPPLPRRVTTHSSVIHCSVTAWRYSVWECHINANINTNTEFPLLASDKVLIQMAHSDLKVENNIWKEGETQSLFLNPVFFFLCRL